MQTVEDRPARAAPADAASGGPGRPRLLAVVDDADALTALQSAAAGQQIELVTEHGAARALQRLAGERFEIVISEWSSAGGDGPRLLSDARRCRPEAVRMLIAPVAATADLLGTLVEAGIYRLIPRPFQVVELCRSLADALEQAGRLEDTGRLRRQPP
jgi:DNA-binding NtrC family response regulator